MRPVAADLAARRLRRRSRPVPGVAGRRPPGSVAAHRGRVGGRRVLLGGGSRQAVCPTVATRLLGRRRLPLQLPSTCRFTESGMRRPGGRQARRWSSSWGSRSSIRLSWSWFLRSIPLRLSINALSSIARPVSCRRSLRTRARSSSPTTSFSTWNVGGRGPWHSRRRGRSGGHLALEHLPGPQPGRRRRGRARRGGGGSWHDSRA